MSDGTKKVPRKRHFISIRLKMLILDRLRNGEKVSYVARTLNLNEATIRTVQKNEEKIRSSVSAGCSISANMTSRPRMAIIEKMEKELNVWISDSLNNHFPLDANLIKQKALQIYTSLRENGESPSNRDFVASKGWFQRFKKRFALQNVKIQGDSSMIDKNEIVKEYSEEFRRIIEERGYTTHQVFNVHETCLWWKKLVRQTFASKKGTISTDSDESNDRVTLLIGSNASGDYIAKPMLVYKSMETRNVKKNSSPISWTMNKNGWITSNLFKKWFFDDFVPNVQKYLEGKNLDLKILLVLDCSSSHPKNLYHPNVEIIFLPENVASSLQPIDQGIVSIFKTNFIKHSLWWIISKMNGKSVEMVWESFTIFDCIDLVSSSIRDIKSSMLNACWKNLWPESVENGNLIESEEKRIEEILKLTKSLGKDEFDRNSEDIRELLMEEEMDERNLMEMMSQNDVINSEDDNVDDDYSDNQNFTLSSIREGINMAKQLEFYFLNEDPSKKRRVKFQRQFQKCFAPYYKIYEDLLGKEIEASSMLNDVKKNEDDSDLFVKDEQESSEDDDILPDRKHVRLTVFKSEDETIV